MPQYENGISSVFLPKLKPNFFQMNLSPVPHLRGRPHLRPQSQEGHGGEERQARRESEHKILF